MVEGFLLPFLLVLTRVSAFIGFLPLFGKRQVPMSVKAGLSVALSVFWLDMAVMDAISFESVGLFGSILLLVKEFVIGTLMAMALGFVLIPVRIAGSYASNQIGLDGANMVDPTAGEPSGVISMLFEALTIILFFSLRMHHFILHCLHESFENPWNLFQVPFEALIEVVNDLPEIGIVIVAPVGICMFVLLIALGFLNKAAPTLNLFSVGIPLQTGLGLLCLILFLPAIMTAAVMYFDSIFLDINDILGYAGDPDIADETLPEPSEF